MDFAIISFTSKASSFSTIIRNAPMAARRSANGSLSPFGAWPIPKIPTKVSNLSASATAQLIVLLGKLSPAKRGIYCSFCAKATASDSPSWRA